MTLSFGKARDFGSARSVLRRVNLVPGTFCVRSCLLATALAF